MPGGRHKGNNIPQPREARRTTRAGPDASDPAHRETKTTSPHRKTKILSQNLRGGKSSDNTEDAGSTHMEIGRALNEFRRSKYQILFGQEHKIAAKHTKAVEDWADQLGLDIYIGTQDEEKAKGGSLIAIKRDMEGYEGSTGGQMLEGRVTWANAKVDDEEWNLRSIYAPSESSQTAKKNFIRALMAAETPSDEGAAPQKLIDQGSIIGGDFNCTASEAYDVKRQNPKKTKSTDGAGSLLESELAARGLTDTWRDQKGPRAFISTFTSAKGTQKRLDRFYMARKRGRKANTTKDATYHTKTKGTRSDHTAIVLM